MKDNPKLYDWDWCGACDPKGSKFTLYETFSVGCFQWIASARSGLKKGKVVKRFSGRTDNPQAVYDKAQSWCDEMNAKTQK